MPTRLARKVKERSGDAAQRAEKAAVRVIACSCPHRPVDQNWPAYDGTAIDKTPVPAVEAAVPVVAHHEIMIRRDNEFAIVNIILDLTGPFRT